MLESDTNLNFDDRHNIRMFILETLRPYFYTEKHPFSYREKVGKILLEAMLKLTNERKYEGEDMVTVRDELLECQGKADSQIYEDPFKKDKAEFGKFLKSSKEYEEYLASGGEDMDKKRFEEEIGLLTEIENINYEDGTSVPYDSIA